MVDFAEPLLELIKTHSDWAAVVMFVTAFGESFPVLGLLFPGTSVLIAAGALLAAGTLPAWPILIGTVLGAVLGDAVSYWLGHRFGHAIARMWPFTPSSPSVARRHAFLPAAWRQERLCRPIFRSSAGGDFHFLPALCGCHPVASGWPI
jgi:membrane protein DedA with SNARE-associated domain